MGFGPPPVDQQRIIDQLVAKGVPLPQAQQMAAQMAGSINGISQSGVNKTLNTALPLAGAAVGAGAMMGGFGGLGGAGAAGGGASGAGGGLLVDGAGAAGAGAAGAGPSLFGLSIPQLLGFAGNAASGIANYAGQEQQRKQQAQEFAMAEAPNIQSLLNRAPVADKAQYLAMNQAAPTAFHPRDYTQGLNQLSQPATGGAAAQLAANAAASANYKPGAGGVQTGTLQAILAKMGYPQSGG